MKKQKNASHTRKTHKKPAFGIAVSMTSASSKTGLSHSTLKAARDAGCDAFRPNGSIDCDRLSVWVCDPANARFVEARASEEDQVRLAILREKLRIVRHKANVLTEQVIPVEKIRETYTRCVLATKSRLLAAETNVTMLATVDLQLSAELATKLREILAREIRESLLELSRCEWAAKTYLCDKCRATVPVTAADPESVTGQ